MFQEYCFLDCHGGFQIEEASRLAARRRALNCQIASAYCCAKQAHAENTGGRFC